MPTVNVDVIKVIGIVILVVLIAACVGVAVASVGDLSAAARSSMDVVSSTAVYPGGADSSGMSPMSMLWGALDGLTGGGVGGPANSTGDSVASGVLRAALSGAGALLIAVVGIKLALRLWG